MNSLSPHFLVGIDLGTTHTVVAYSRTDDPERHIHLFDIPQLIAPGEVAERPLLPSVRYHPAVGEMAEASNFLTPLDRAVIGEAARLLGAKTQGRMVASAKSWLSHTAIDPAAPILPWGSDDTVDKVSPLAASASYLRHVRLAWEQRFNHAPLSEQYVVITVPASFDESARSLTLKAAELAGFGKVRLLEEPQAVCYDWLRRHAGRIAEALAGARLLLVCDVGGGTTDFTLIRIEYTGSEPKLTRIGVGDHLMLGGDNIDLALAHLAENRLRTDDRKLSASEMSQLIEQCRIAKERLLAQDAPERMAITLLGGGSRLIGGSRSTELTRDEVGSIAVDGFMPLSDFNDLPDKKRSGVVEFGLPYAAEPAISKHIAAFLHTHAQAAKAALGNERPIPDAVLLNGGVFRSPALSRRIIDLLTLWRGEPPSLLDNDHPELAVAQGAVAYALAQTQKTLKIGGGAARSYFLMIAGGADKNRRGVCLLPKGSEEGRDILLTDRQFALRVGQPVRFHLLTASGDGDYSPGDVVDLDDESFHSLPPLVVALEGEAKTAVTVQLLAAYTEVGTLQLQCVAVDDFAKRWNVEFPIRRTGLSPRQAELPQQLALALEKIAQVFGAKSKNIDPQAVKTLRSDLEKVLAMPRTEWQTPLLRELFGALLEGSKYRRRSEQHERVWLSLTGFCLRPGFGYPLDDWRVEQLWALYRDGLQFVNEKQNWTEWWTLWRRVAGGLSVEAQQRIVQDIGKFIDPASARQPGIAKQLAIRGYDDMVRLAASLERLPVSDKTMLGDWLLKRLQKPGEPEQTWWALGRIGSRVPFHAAAHDVIPVERVAQWLQILLQSDWRKQVQAAFAATLLARRCDDRVRDIDDELRRAVVDKLRQAKAPAAWQSMVETWCPLDAQQEKQVFGEALPPGLILLE
ncbi:MAG: molecular chaperone DnaK [Methylomonas sp.]|nr:MAG: molecular chaperone DnaK [Methylomonas sp.]PPD26999.1 MAG: molecular chaperone DnaK [Methylomonas sp.]PPD38938.1 MAG: molecular chaperone DnaK [Methylomonas sp.]PPD42578.1 MAG: molecular chaperone DnaK [Methylomonas sp.]PPD54150.1 MAG: molecular chaperone DnaK [Methylomonas sp.]